jgi:hypothetical protein
VKNLFSLLLVAVLILSVVHIQDARAISDPDPSSDGPITVEMLSASAETAVHEAQWKRFSTNLVVALGSDHAGVQQTAMRYVIQYNDQVDVADAVFDVMKIYRNDADDNRRRMAVVTLGNMNSDWAILFLERSEPFEKSDIVAQTIRAVISG